MREKAALCHFHNPELIPVALLLKLCGHRVIYDVHEDLPRQIRSKDWLVGPGRWVIAGLAGGLETVANFAFDAIVAATPAIARRFSPAKTVLVQNYPAPRNTLPGAARVTSPGAGGWPMSAASRGFAASGKWSRRCRSCRRRRRRG